MAKISSPHPVCEFSDLAYGQNSKQKLGCRPASSDGLPAPRPELIEKRFKSSPWPSGPSEFPQEPRGYLLGKLQAPSSKLTSLLEYFKVGQSNCLKKRPNPLFIIVTCNQ